ncbi:hypothetical protein BBJ28_00024258, partial [Nothophytophthora sp. Chile5]
MGSRNYGNNNNHLDMEDPSGHGSDALDNLSRRYPKKASAPPQEPIASPMPLEAGTLNSLALLKSKMSRRKSRSAPTNQASLFVEKNVPSSVDEYADGSEQMEECHNCSRKFNVASFQKHRKVCEKVFSGQRKAFNMTAKRLEGTEAEKLSREAKGKGSSGGGKKALSATEQPINVKTNVDWKQKSDMFRNAMKASRDVSKALKEGKELPPMVPSAPDPSLIQCEYCSRRFNDKAAERHINFCREKSQRDSMKGPAKKAPATKPGSR